MSGKFPIPEPVIIKVPVPQYPVNFFFNGFVFFLKRLRFLFFPQDRRHAHQHLRIQGIKGRQIDAIHFQCSFLVIERNIIVIGQVVFTGFPRRPFPALRTFFPFRHPLEQFIRIAAPFQQAVFVAVAPGITVDTRHFPELMPFLQGSVRIGKQGNIIGTKIGFKYGKRPHRGLGTVRGAPVSRAPVGNITRGILGIQHRFDFHFCQFPVFYHRLQCIKKRIPFKYGPQITLSVRPGKYPPPARRQINPFLIRLIKFHPGQVVGNRSDQPLPFTRDFGAVRVIVFPIRSKNLFDLLKC